MSDYLEKFQRLLRELFQFDCADLDFGIYRIMNHKRGVIEKFITKDLPKVVAEELDRGALADQSRITRELKEVADQIRETLGKGALDADGNLSETYHETPLGKKYLKLREKAAGGRGRENLEGIIFNHLYTFFGRYYQDGDFISKRRYSRRQKYAIPYNGEEVYLYWANHDQYYIKTAEYFYDYSYKAPNGVIVHFKLTAAHVEQDNVKGDKRFFLPRVKKINWDEEANRLVIPFEYRPLTEQEENVYGKKKQQDKIISETLEEIPRRLQKAIKALAAIMTERHKTADGRSVSFLEHHLRRYMRRNTSDFFIHKDLKGFLSRELDFYLKNEVLNLDELEAAGEARAEGWFQIMRVIKTIGMRIIEFLAQIEDFQKMLWEKRKFITESQYCITVGNIDERFYPEIAVCEAQWEEWKALFHIDGLEKGLFSSDVRTREGRIAFLKAHPTLVLDTKHFDQDFVDRVLASFHDLDGMTDGLLVHSENWQALNLLLEKYRERVKCIYIDPPYNTDASPIIYKNDYRSSSWVSMMDDRLMLSHSFLQNTGMLAVAIDDFQQKELHFLVEKVFGRQNLLATVVVRSNPSGRPGTSGFSTAHEYLIFASKSPDVAVTKLQRTERLNRRYKYTDENGLYMWELLRKRGSGSERKDSPKLYYPLYVGSKGFRVPKMIWNDIVREWVVQEAPSDDEIVAYPIDENGIHRRWRWAVETVRNNLNELKAVKHENGVITIYYKYRPPNGVLPTTLWIDAKYSATEHGTNVLKSFFREYNPFSFPKSIHATSDALVVMGALENGIYVVDFFAGSGTTGHAVINLNREDGGRRRFILVEMGQHFDTVLLPRIKKVTFTPEWKDGVPRRMATQEEAERAPRIVKYIRLESYEDTLNNIEFDDVSGQKALKFDDYLLQYMLKWETRKSETLLNVEKLARPFSYKLHIHVDGQTREKVVDIPETFNYLLGLHVRIRQILHDGDRRYLVYRGESRGGKKITVIWRETESWTKEDLERDKKFVAEQNLTEGADEVFVNGDSFIRKARALEPVFKTRMFAPVEA
jgi:adenine-specific DNA-methyltransferase